MSILRAAIVLFLAERSSAEGDAVHLRGSIVDGRNWSNASQSSTVPCWSGLQPVSEYLACLAAVPLDAEIRDCTLQILGEQFSSLYTYSSLVKNSTNNDAKLPPGFNFEVYNVTLGPYIDALWAQLGAETSAGLFALRLTEFFRKLQDAHTSIAFQFLQRTYVYPPLKVHVQLNETSGEMQFRVSSYYKGWALAGMLGKTIASINGQLPLEYYLSVAELWGFDKSRGAQLNRFLTSQHLNGVAPPADGAFDVVFTDGSEEQLHWMAWVPAAACHLGETLCSKEEVLGGNCSNTTQLMKQCFSYSEDFRDISYFMAKIGRPLPCLAPPAPDTLAPSSSLARSALGEAAALESETPREEAATLEAALLEAELEMEFAAGEPDSVADSVMRSRGTEQGCHCKKSWTFNGTRCDSFCCNPDNDPLGDWCVVEGNSCNLHNPVDYCTPPIQVNYTSSSCNVLVTTLANASQATVLKISSFDSFDDLLPCAEAAVAKAAEVSEGHLIVDVISNGGGQVNSGYELNRYLYSKMPGTWIKKPIDACAWYDLPKTPELSLLVELSQQPLPRLEEVPQPREHVAGVAQRMRTVMDALKCSDSSGGKCADLSSAVSCLDALTNNITIPRNVSQQYQFFFDACIEGVRPFEKGGFTLLEYRKSNKFPDTESPPSWEYYTDTVTKNRGGEVRNFSSLTFMGVACRPYMAEHQAIYGHIAGFAEPQQQLRRLTYLSDGLCGSTCSVSSTEPYLEGLSTFVTFGGVKGETMDITSFNGGNVAEYQPFWHHALEPTIDASIFFPEATPPRWPFAPVPMNLAYLSYAQRAQYPRALGADALPREWYKIPASYHLDVWPKESLRDFARLSREGKRQLYDLYAASAKLDAKPFVKEAEL